jgi:CDP-glucose 4,6-dehydratase
MSFWSGRRVLVTGHTGFKGSWLALMLMKMGAHVYGLALAPAAKPNLFDLLGLADEMESKIGDVRDAAVVNRSIEQARPDVIFHLAAQSLVRVSYREPVSTFDTNVMGTAHILEAARSYGPCRVVVVTSDKCYRNDESAHPFGEDDPLGGEDPYSSSKAAAEIVTHAYAASYGTAEFRVASARAGNVIGGGDWSPDRLVPDIVRAIAADRPLVLRYPQSVRPWQHVLEPLSGYIALAASLEKSDGGAWNFGPQADDHVTVIALARELYAAFAKPERIEIDPGVHAHEAAQLRLDASKARDRLGWHGKLDARKAIAWTASWYRDVANGADARDVTLKQIEAYSAKH